MLGGVITPRSSVQPMRADRWHIFIGGTLTIIWVNCTIYMDIDLLDISCMDDDLQYGSVKPFVKEESAVTYLIHTKITLFVFTYLNRKQSIR